MYSFTEKRCIVQWVSHFLSKKKGYILHHKIEQLCNWKYLRKIIFCFNASYLMCYVLRIYFWLIVKCRFVNLAIFCNLPLKKPPFFLILVCIIQQLRRRCVKILSFGANHLRLFDPFAPYFIDSYSHLRKLAMCTLSHVAKLFERISFSSKRTYVHVRTHRIFSLRVYTNIFCILYMWICCHIF